MTFYVFHHFITAQNLDRKPSVAIWPNLEIRRHESSVQNQLDRHLIDLDTIRGVKCDPYPKHQWKDTPYVEAQFSEKYEAIRTRTGVLLREIQPCKKSLFQLSKTLRRREWDQLHRVYELSIQRDELWNLMGQGFNWQSKLRDFLAVIIFGDFEWLTLSTNVCMTKRCSLVTVASPDSLQGLPQVEL